MNFKLIGRTTVFAAAEFYTAAGFIRSVRRVTLDGKFQTCARVVDVKFLDGVAS